MAYTTHERRKAARDSAPLVCRRCGSKKLTITAAQQMLAVAGHKRLHVSVRCANGHEFWSRNQKALEISRAKDARAAHAKNGKRSLDEPARDAWPVGYTDGTEGAA